MLSPQVISDIIRRVLRWFDALRLRDFGIHSSGILVYFAVNQLIVFAVLSRRLTPAAFGQFALAYSMAALAVGATSKMLQHTVIQQYGDEESGFWDNYRKLWLIVALACSIVFAILYGTLGGPLSIHAGDNDVELGIAFVSYIFSHLIFDAATTAGRIRQSYASVTNVYLIYSLILGGGVLSLSAPTPQTVLFIYAAAATIPLLLWGAKVGIFCGTLTKMSVDGMGLTEMVRRLPANASFAVASTLPRYIDRLVIGAVAGAASAGVYFACVNSVMAILMPAAFIAPFMHSVSAAHSNEEIFLRRIRRVYPWSVIMGATVLPLLVLVGAVAVMWVVYPTVPLRPLVLPLFLYGIGKSLFTLRETWIPALSRFRGVKRIAQVDGLSILPHMVLVGLLGFYFGASGGLIASAAALVVNATLTLFIIGGFVSERSKRSNRRISADTISLEET